MIDQEGWGGTWIDKKGDTFTVDGDKVVGPSTQGVFSFTSTNNAKLYRP